MKIFWFSAVVWIWSTVTVVGQDIYKFRPVNNIPVSSGNSMLGLAWAGGINSGQYNTMDLNLDGTKDLVIFDRTTNKVSTFINTGSDYLYQPQYEYYFPANLDSWILLADYNCDGRKDIFSNTTFGLKVYRNTSVQQLSFELQADPLETESDGSMVNLQVSSSDLPSVTDVDGDGDLDILVFRFATGNSIEYHENLSIESLGSCELQYKLVTNFWGGLRECTCGEYAYGEDCGTPGGRQQHAGGKSILTFDQDHDGDLDLIFGDEFCNNIAFLQNHGDADNAVFTEATLDYPAAANPIDFFIFPGLFLEDLDFDGRKDLIASPNLFDNPGNGVDFKHSSYFYSNTGASDGEYFSFQNAQFLQDQMIELGEGATPVFFDVDGDGDQDLVAGHRGIMQGSAFTATFYLFINTGSPLEAQFELASEDFLGLSSVNLNTLKPSFGDLDGDGRKDLVFSAANDSGQTFIWYFLNDANSGFTPVDPFPQVLNSTIQAGDHPYFYDINNDGKADLLLGRRTGRLEYWLNTSSAETLSLELVDDQVAGVVDDSFKRELAPLVADLNNDGAVELVTVDATGVIRVYSNFISGSSGAAISFEQIIETGEGQPLNKSRIGRGGTLAIADLGHQMPHLVIGSRQGGLFLLENNSLAGNGSGEGVFALEAFPNPATGLVTFRGNQIFTIEIYNSLGQLVLGDLRNPSQSLIRFDSRALHPGIYLVNGISATGRNQSVKLLVTH